VLALHTPPSRDRVARLRTAQRLPARRGAAEARPRWPVAETREMGQDRYGVSSRCTPSVIGKSVCHVKTTVSGARLQAAGRSPLGPGDNAAVFPRPGLGQTGRPLPRRKAPGIPSKDSIGLNPHPKTLRNYRSKATIVLLVNYIRT